MIIKIAVMKCANCTKIIDLKFSLIIIVVCSIVTSLFEGKHHAAQTVYLYTLMMFDQGVEITSHKPLLHHACS